MKLHIVTVGKPKLSYAVAGWDDYLGRLQRLHTVRVTQLSDKYTDDAAKFRGSDAGSIIPRQYHTCASAISSVAASIPAS
jgi:23S rRNA pseudoU1915 N3-methylase RlmH